MTVGDPLRVPMDPEAGAVDGAPATFTEAAQQAARQKSTLVADMAEVVAGP